MPSNRARFIQHAEAQYRRRKPITNDDGDRIREHLSLVHGVLPVYNPYVNRAKHQKEHAPSGLAWAHEADDLFVPDDIEKETGDE